MKIITFVLVLCLFSCNGISVTKALPGGYVLLKDNDEQANSISFDYGNGNYIECIPPNIIKCVNDNNFIIAKQKPLVFSESNENINYYIIPLLHKISSSADLNKIGPLDQNNFDKKVNELNVPQSLITSLQSNFSNQ